MLEASGAYDADACDPGGCGYPSMAATESRCALLHAHVHLCQIGPRGLRVPYTYRYARQHHMGVCPTSHTCCHLP